MVKIDVSFNGHAIGCVCIKCGQARALLVPFRRKDKNERI